MKIYTNQIAQKRLQNFFYSDFTGFQIVTGNFSGENGSSARVPGNGKFAGKMLRAPYGKIIVYDSMRETQEVLAGTVL